MATLFVLFFLFALLCTWCAKLQSKLGRPLQWSDLQVAVSGVPYQMALLGKEIIPTINQIKESWKKDGPELMATLREFPRVVLQWVHRKCNIVNSTITIGVIVLSFVGVLVMWGDIASFIPLLIGAAFLLVRTLIVLLLSKVIHSIPRGVWIGIFIGLSMAMSCGEAEAASVVAYSSFNASFYAAAIFLPLVVAAIAGLIVRHWAIARKLLMVSMAIILFPACYGAPALSGYGLMVLGTIMFFIGAVDNKVELPASTPTEIEIEMEKKEWEEMFCWDQCKTCADGYPNQCE